MKNPGPPLEAMMDRLTAIPEEFFKYAENPRSSESGIYLPALVNDMLQDNGGAPVSDDEILQHLTVYADKKYPDRSGKNPNYPGLLSILCYIFEDVFFTGKKNGAELIRQFLLSQELIELSNSVESADEFITDPDRREEICRRTLDALNYCPQGENEKDSADRLLTLDSVERKKILAKTNEAQFRAKQLREAMMQKEAEEAASKMSRE